MTTDKVTRVSFRDVREAAARALMAHGASPGEARVAAAMVLDAELVDGVGLAALIDDLAREPWSRTPVQVAPVTARGDAAAAGADDRLALGWPGVNRLLREGPLAVELVAGEGEVRAVAVPCAVAASSLLDAVTLEVARTSGAEVVVVVCTSAASEPAGTGRDQTLRAQLRVATPGGSIGVGTNLSWLPAGRELLDGPGLLALRDVDRPGDATLSWSSAEDRARARVAAAEQGLRVETGSWARVYDASRRYLVPS